MKSFLLLLKKKIRHLFVLCVIIKAEMTTCSLLMLVQMWLRRLEAEKLKKEATIYLFGRR